MGETTKTYPTCGDTALHDGTIVVKATRDTLSELVAGRLADFTCENPLPKEYKLVQSGYDPLCDHFYFIFDNGKGIDGQCPWLYQPTLKEINESTLAR